MKVFLLQSLLNKITGSVGRWVGGLVLDGRWSVDLIKPLKMWFSTSIDIMCYAEAAIYAKTSFLSFYSFLVKFSE